MHEKAYLMGAYSRELLFFHKKNIEIWKVDMKKNSKSRLIKIILLFITIQIPFTALLLGTEQRKYPEAWLISITFSLLGSFGILWLDKRRKSRQTKILQQRLICSTKPQPRPDKIRMEGGIIHYESPEYSWELPLSRLKLLGEYTNQNGPFADDWFLIFATHPEDSYHASVYAEGMTELLEQLSRKLGNPIDTTLVASTDFNSNVIWPEKLAGRDMFDFVNEGRTGFLGKIFGVHNVRAEFKQEILGHIESAL